MTTRVVGIDPGKTGAYAIIEENGVFLGDLQIMTDRTLAWVDSSALSLQLAPIDRGTIVVVERISPNPVNGSIAAFSQGQTLGSILATVQIMGFRIEFVPPGKWKADLGLRPPRGKKQTDTERKHAALSKARLLYPMVDLPLVKHHNRAEALLIAHWFVNHARPWKAAA